LGLSGQSYRGGHAQGREEQVSVECQIHWRRFASFDTLPVKNEGAMTEVLRNDLGEAGGAAFGTPLGLNALLFVPAFG
jgi:hypothetical protein